MKPTEHFCPHCRKPCLFDPSNKWRPFCSERCRLIDLGEWVSGERRIPGPPASPEDLDNAELVDKDSKPRS